MLVRGSCVFLQKKAQIRILLTPFLTDYYYSIPPRKPSLLRKVQLTAS